MVYHTVVLDVNSGTSPIIPDIPQGDKNSHQLYIKLVSKGKFFDISDYDSDPEITFYDEASDTTVLSGAVNVVNSYRGYLSYIIGPRFVKNYGRYTVTLKLNKDGVAQMSCNFILNITKSTDGLDDDCPYCEEDVEVTISKQFYESLESHLISKDIHLSESDRGLLQFISDNLDTFVTTSDLNNIFDVISGSTEFKRIVREAVFESLTESAVVDEVTDAVINAVDEKLSNVTDSLEKVEGDVDDLKKDVDALTIKSNWKSL